MEWERITEFVLRIGDKRYRARFKGKTPANEMIFKLFVKTRISQLVEGQIVFADGTERYFSKGVFYFPEPDLTIFYSKSGILSDRRRFERFKISEMLGYITDIRQQEKKMAVSAYDISEAGTKIATYYPLVERKQRYLLELNLDSKVFRFFNLQMGSVIFTSHCEVVNMQVGENGEIFYGVSFTKTSFEHQRIIRTFLRDYAIVLEDEHFDGKENVSEAKNTSLIKNKDFLDKTLEGKNRFRGVVYTSDIKMIPDAKKEAPENSDVAKNEISKPSDSKNNYVNLTDRPIVPSSTRVFIKSVCRVILCSAVGFLVLYIAFFCCQRHTTARLMKEIVKVPNFTFLSDASQEPLKQQPSVKKPVQEDVLKWKKVDVPQFTPTVAPTDITPANFVNILKENKLPVYSIDDTDYVSIRSLLKLFNCAQTIEKNKKVVAIPYKDDRIVLRLETSDMIIKGDRVSMAYPVKKVLDEFLVSVDVMEEALILASR